MLTEVERERENVCAWLMTKFTRDSALVISLRKINLLSILFKGERERERKRERV